MSECHPIGVVCSRSGVRLYAATARSGPSLPCAAARFGFVVPKKDLSLLEGLDFKPAASATTKFKDSFGINMTMKTFFTFRTE